MTHAYWLCVYCCAIPVPLQILLCAAPPWRPNPDHAHCLLTWRCCPASMWAGGWLAAYMYGAGSAQMWVAALQSCSSPARWRLWAAHELPAVPANQFAAWRLLARKWVQRHTGRGRVMAGMQPRLALSSSASCANPHKHFSTKRLPPTVSSQAAFMKSSRLSRGPSSPCGGSSTATKTMGAP